MNLDRSVLAVVRGRATSGDLVGDRLAMICFSRRVGEIRVHICDDGGQLWGSFERSSGHVPVTQVRAECVAELLLDVSLCAVGLVHPVVLYPLGEDWKWDVRSGDS